MKRPVGVILTVVVQVLASLLVGLLSVLTLFMPAIMRNTSRPTPPSPMEPQIFYGSAAVYGVFAMLGLLTAIGGSRVKNWARYSTLVFAGLLVFMGLTTALVFALMPLPASPADARSVTPNAMITVRTIMTAFPLGLAALGAMWLYYFNRAAIKSYFAQSEAGSDLDAKGVLVGGRCVPLSIFVIASLNLIGAIFFMPFAVWSRANIFFGFIVTGVATKLITFLIGICGIYIGIALLRLSNSGRRLAIAFNCLWLLNSVVLFLTPNRLRQYFEIYEQAFGTPMPSALPPDTMVTYTRFGMLLGTAVTIIILYFLVTRASAF